MTSYRYLGYGVTDSNGVAHLKYDKDGHEITPQGYHGTGAGEVNVIASVDKPITSSSIVSEIYEVIDATFYDDGISGTASWDTAQAVADRTSGQYTELSASDSTKFQVEAITDSIAIELDYYCTDTSEKGISIRQASNEVWSRTLTQLGVNVNTWCHLKIVLNNGEYQLFVDNVDKTPSTHIIGAFNRFFFRVTSDYRIRYKNFVIYPI